MNKCERRKQRLLFREKADVENNKIVLQKKILNTVIIQSIANVNYIFDNACTYSYILNKKFFVRRAMYTKIYFQIDFFCNE